MIPPGMQCAIGNYAKRLMVDAQVWRKETTTDEGGGRSSTGSTRNARSASS
ncbi:hypothetical protein [Nesterenkonia sp. PF2B19]|uniref:hypothetical protein n=1 Tax=Nesterenkonia sp. PF2B19 TaxID=1881858 RepID=UPI001F2977DD|nr:hypothetical protein [Nesterenkonia sp. PF2B19]